jgi:hypothetical protein
MESNAQLVTCLLQMVAVYCLSKPSLTFMALLLQRGDYAVKLKKEISKLKLRKLKWE